MTKCVFVCFIARYRVESNIHEDEDPSKTGIDFIPYTSTDLFFAYSGEKFVNNEEFTMATVLGNVFST